MSLAIAKSPNWIQRELTKQFQSLADPEPYADLIMNASKQYTDEIAFSIACSPLGNVPPVDLIRDNVFTLYANDRWIQYANIIDRDDGTGDYYSTIQYKILENGEEKQFECPKEIYYWYVVHPKLTMDQPVYRYNMFWREYLFNHNDLGYPLLKEKLSTIKYLWDCESYYQPAYRLWKWSANNHPTAIEVISYWVGKTVPNEAFGDRPNQPSAIAHEHNGWCGELQQIAAAALRTALIPSIGASNIAEDHVWREFFERGWHENDNWWSDTGGAVDEPDAYAYGWRKNMSSILGWRGDDIISNITPHYIHPEDRITIKFVVKDIFLQPVDGARVIVMVKGLKDITGLKNTLWEKIQTLWDKLPPFLKEKILKNLYERIKQIYNKIPDTTKGYIFSIWNYTDMNGECTFELGKNLEYFFIIQQGNLDEPSQLARHNAIRILNNHKDKTFHVILGDMSYRIQRHINRRMPAGVCFFNVSFSTASYQVQKNLWTNKSGIFNTNGLIDLFFVDKANFEKYVSGKRFTCYSYTEANRGHIQVPAVKKDWYLILRNHARDTNVVVDFSLQVEVPTDRDMLQIVAPDTSIFATPVCTVGDRVSISGIATDDIILSINGEPRDISTIKYQWHYEWNTSGLMPGKYRITADCGDAHDERLITVIDAIPPGITIDEPIDGEIVEKGILTIAGRSWDNTGVERVDVAIDDNEYREANGTKQWSVEWNIDELELGTHTILARAIDVMGYKSLQKIFFVVNESGHDWCPAINTFYHMPEYPTNNSNVIIYTNVTKTSPFAIKNVVLFYNNGIETHSYEMYRYADHPVQERHKEDPLQNDSNEPIFGIELGQFFTGETITYWVVAYDLADNSRISSEKSFIVS